MNQIKFVIVLLYITEVRSNIRVHGFRKKNLPKDIVVDVQATNQQLQSNAHILQTTVQYSSDKILLMVDQSVLPPYFKHFNKLVKLFVNFKVINNQTFQDLWVKTWPTSQSLARVSTAMVKVGYNGIILKKLYILQNKQQGLHMKIGPGHSKINDIVSLKPIFVAVFIKTTPFPSIKCNFLKLDIPLPVNILFPNIISTKICSPAPVFPYNDSSFFDIGKSVYRHLKNNIKTKKFLGTNPSCCHAVKSIPINVLLSTGITIVLGNSKITECGCI